MLHVHVVVMDPRIFDTCIKFEKKKKKEREGDRERGREREEWVEREVAIFMCK